MFRTRRPQGGGYSGGRLKRLVFKVPLALLRLCVFVLAQNIFIELACRCEESFGTKFRSVVDP